MSLQASNNLQNNLAFPLSIANNNKNQQMQVLEKIISQKNNLNNLGKLSQQQINLMKEITPMNMLSSAAGGNSMSLMNGLIPNLQKAQNNTNLNNLYRLMECDHFL